MKHYIGIIENQNMIKAYAWYSYITQKKYLLNEIIFIGDSDSDKEAANQNNLPFVAVLSGMGMEIEKYKIGYLNGLKPLIDSFKH